MKRAAVIGWPVSHSLSPRLHHYWLKQYGIDGHYQAIAVEPAKLAEFLKTLPASGLVGVNLTIPHKEQALDLVDEIDDTARHIGAVNTILMRDGKLFGTNTDAYGFIHNLRSAAVTKKKALVIGAGGASRAVCAGLLKEGYAIALINRTREKADHIAAVLGGKISVMPWERYGEAMKDIGLLVNTTSLGMKGQAPLTLSLDTLPTAAVVTDIVYTPLNTALLAAAETRGNPVLDGLGMLLYQAQPAFEAFFGFKPEVTGALKAHMVEALK